MTQNSLPSRIAFDFRIDSKRCCPNCTARGLLIFYSIDDIPVHSCLLVPNRAEAVRFPRGNLKLGFCSACGFVTNTWFDPSVHDYSSRYEETQGFSGRFNAFAESLAKRIVSQYALQGKDVLEIGCGKGEFLFLLNRYAGSRCVGIDPSYVPERMPVDAGTPITFIRDFYSEKYSHLAADFVCCRHTLEHIAPTHDFLHTVRKSIGERLGSLVFFEVPDVLRVLREGAFWDIYYEHCSYFTPGSLARLFRAAGFDLLELSLDFDSQYVLLMARPASHPTQPALALEHDLEQVADAVINFEDACSRRISDWRRRIAECSASGPTVVWGSGSKGVAFLTTLGVTKEIEYVVDINPHRHGKFMPGSAQQIVPPEFMAKYQPKHVIVMNPVYCQEIRRDLDRVGVKAELWPV